MIDKIKELRGKTDVSVMVCKKALEEAGGDFDKALLILRKEGAKIAGKKAERELKAGVIGAYIHSTKQIGVLIEVRCETDFVAKNEDFQEFVRNVAMHIAACEPKDAGALLGQPYIKNPDITVSDYIKETIQKFGENTEVPRFERYQV